MRDLIAQIAAVAQQNGGLRALDVQYRSLETAHSRVAYLDTTGRGLPLVVLHGNSVSKESYEPQIEALGSSYRIIAIDLPGHGSSADATDAARTYSFAGYADCIAELLGQLEIAEYALLGHSLGGHVAIELSDRLTPRGMVLSGSPPFRRNAAGMAEAFGADSRAMLSFKPELTEEEVADFSVCVQGAAGGAEIWRNMVKRTDPRARSMLGATILSENVADQRQLAEAFPGPTLVINGAADPFINHDYAEAVGYRNLWGGRVFRLERQAHAPHLNAPTEFNALLADFLHSLS